MKLSALGTFLVSIKTVFGSPAMIVIVLPMALFSFLPLLIADFAATPSYSPSEIVENLSDFLSALVPTILLALLYMFYGSFAAGAVMGMVKHGIKTGKSSLFAGIRVGTGKLLPILKATILSSILLAFGFALLLLPGIMLLVFLFYFMPAIVMDDCGPLKSLKKSFQCSKGNLFYTIVLLLILMVLFAVYEGIIYAVAMLSPDAAPFLTAIVRALFTILFYPVAITTATVGYLNVR